MEMILQFNHFAATQNMPDKDKVRDPVSSAFAKLQEHAAFWTYVKSAMRDAGAEDPAEAQHVEGQPYKVGERVGNLIVTEIGPSGMAGFSCCPNPGTVSAPAEQPTTTSGQPHIQGNAAMSTDTVNPFSSSPESQNPDLGPPADGQPQQMSNTGLLVAAGLGVLLIGGLIAADMYRTSKGIRPVVVSPPMMPMGVYY